MKKILVTIISFFLGVILYGQKEEISFVNNELPENPSDSLVSDWDDRISEIVLKENNQFLFWVRPQATSCFTWRNYDGEWKKINDTIIFSDKYEITESDSKHNFSNDPENNFYLLRFKTDKNSKLTEKNIQIEFVYDFDSHQENIEQQLELRKDFSLKIPYKSIPHQSELASIKYTYTLPNGEIRSNYITESKFVNLKEKDLPNIITITLIESPIVETVFRITKGILKQDELTIISTKKTKSSLKDDTDKLRFKDSYIKQNQP